jgi:hypothetical protein
MHQQLKICRWKCGIIDIYQIPGRPDGDEWQAGSAAAPFRAGTLHPDSLHVLYQGIGSLFQ